MHYFSFQRNRQDFHAENCEQNYYKKPKKNIYHEMAVIWTDFLSVANNEEFFNYLGKRLVFVS